MIPKFQIQLKGLRFYRNSVRTKDWPIRGRTAVFAWQSKSSRRLPSLSKGSQRCKRNLIPKKHIYFFDTQGKSNPTFSIQFRTCYRSRGVPAL